MITQSHRGPTDVEYDRPPHPKMARAVSASGLYASIVNLHALKCWLFVCELTYKVHMNSCECCIYGKKCPSSLYRRWQNSVGMWRTTKASGTHDVMDDNLGCGRRHLSVNISNHIKRVLICGRWISHGQLFTSEPWENQRKLVICVTNSISHKHPMGLHEPDVSKCLIRYL